MGNLTTEQGLTRVQDKGSKLRRANVVVAGVPTNGVIDSGADITIVGGDLFRRIVAVEKVKKRQFKPVDKLPHTYDRRPFHLDGKIDVDITFTGTTMKTTVYVKLDAAEQLLLSEGVCRQLGIIQYHPDVWMAESGGNKRHYNKHRYLSKPTSSLPPSEERTESGTHSPSHQEHSLPPSEEHTESGTHSPSRQEHTLPPSEERTESGTLSPSRQEHSLPPSEERTESGTHVHSHQEHSLPPSEERTESGTHSPSCQEHSLPPSEERTESGTHSPSRQEHSLPPSEERTESGTHSPSRQEHSLPPSEERTESGTHVHSHQEHSLPPSEERTESGTHSPSRQEHSLPPSEERTESGTHSPSRQEHSLPPSEEHTESGTHVHSHQEHSLSPSEERTESGTHSPSRQEHSLPPSEERTESGTHSPSRQEHSLPPSEEHTAIVRLVQSVRILPHQSQRVMVKLEGNRVDAPFLVECHSDLKGVADLEGEDAIVCPDTNGLAYVPLSNTSGFTQTIDSGIRIGEATTVAVEEPNDLLLQKEGTCRQQDRVTQAIEQEEAVVQLVGGPPVTPDDEDRRAQMIRTLFGTIDIPVEHKETLMQLLIAYNTVFSLDEGERGETDLVEFHIHTGDTVPLWQRPRRMPFAVRKEVARQLELMQNTRVIQPSTSPWASPVVLVRKKDGSHRFCVDYRRLNAVTKLDSYPLPRIDDLLDQLAQTRYFTSLDLASGYWQIRVHQDSVPKTAFITPQGLYEFRVMPFGLTNAPSTFQRLMQELLAGLNPPGGDAFVSVYIDDVLIYSRTMEDHLAHLRAVLGRLQEAGLKLKPAKCRFMCKEVEFLGHCITPMGLKTTPRLVTAVLEFRRPTNARQTRQFLGLCSFYRRFIESFARIARPLHQLTKMGTTFHWTPECQAAFNTLKTKLCETPVLAYPAFDKDFVLETDASIDGIGAVLSQVQQDGCLHPVAFASRSLSSSERNYGITDLETLAVVWAITHFRCYIYGHALTVYTDHSAVRSVLETPSPSGRHARWWTRVYGSGIRSINIIYRSGKANSNADALSRNPVGEAPKEGVGESEVQVATITSESGEATCNNSPGEGLSGQTAVIPSDPTISDLLVRRHIGADETPFVTEQSKDPTLADMIKYLDTKQLPPNPQQAQRVLFQSPLFTLVNSVLHFTKGSSIPRPVVPRHLRQQLMEDNHRGPHGSHFSRNKLFQTISRHWWWQGMYADITQFVCNCPECTIVSGGERSVVPPLHPIPGARQLAAESLQQSQDQSKHRYDAKAVVRNFRCGDWVLVRFPSEETGRNRKISQPWHGPYRILDVTDTTVRVEKVYRTKHDPLHVHQSRVKFFPPNLPPGYYWYGRGHSCPGKVPQWVERIAADHTPQLSPNPSTVHHQRSQAQDTPQQRPDEWGTLQGGQEEPAAQDTPQQRPDDWGTLQGEQEEPAAQDTPQQRPEDWGTLQAEQEEPAVQDTSQQGSDDQDFPHGRPDNRDPVSGQQKDIPTGNLRSERYSLRREVRPPERWSGPQRQSRQPELPSSSGSSFVEGRGDCCEAMSTGREL